MGPHKKTINQRKTKGDGKVAKILSIMKEIPLGKHKVHRLQEAMLINAILFNSEAWHGVTAAQIVKLESVDEALLREILKATVMRLNNNNCEEILKKNNLQNFNFFDNARTQIVRKY